MGVCSVTPVLNVSSVGESFAWFERLGWKRGFSWNQGGMIRGGADANEHGLAGFGSVCSGDAQIFLCWGLRDRAARSSRSFPVTVRRTASG